MFNSDSNLSASKTPRKTPSRAYGDRFIPNRDSLNTKGSQLFTCSNENSAPDTNTLSQEFNSQLAQSLFQGDDINSKFLAFKTKAPKPTEEHQNNLRVLYTQNKVQSAAQKVTRYISSTPERILDAPDLLNDYYLNLLDWSCNNVLAIALGGVVYLWNSSAGSIDQLCECKLEGEVITSVKWMADGSFIAIGTSLNDVQLWNVEKKKQVRSMKGHQARVGALAWNQHVLSSGSRDASIINHDVRIAQHNIATLQSHTQEVCGLSWSIDGSQLASGGNDNKCIIWDVNSTSPKFVLEDSCAAVKALAWCPFQKNLLATGSGTADRHIRFYNTLTGAVVNTIDTKSQVCSLVWSKTEKEILSSHGFSQNQLTVWKYPTMVKVGELTGHTERVLHTALSPDGTTVVSAAADETLRFWKVWDAPKKAPRRSPAKTTSSRINMNIR